MVGIQRRWNLSWKMKISKLLMITGALLLLSLFLVPLWNISILAPQYPEAIGMNIWVNEIVDMNENDIKNINILNHYIGMKDIPTDLPEFKIFPIVIILMVVLGIIIGLIGNPKLYLIWLIVMALLGTAGMYDFYLWESEYGHNLSENAAIKLTDAEGIPMVYQPPLFGTKPLLSFTAMSYPRLGAYIMVFGMGLTLFAFFRSIKEEKVE